MKKILIYAANYNDDGHHQSFITTRIKEYIKRGYKIDLIIFSKKKLFKIKNLKYLRFQNHNHLENFLIKSLKNYQYFFIHFITFRLIKTILKVNYQNIIVWIHGIEGQRWHWYNFDLFVKPKFWIKNLIYNYFQLFYLKLFLNKKNISLIFVSKWMKETFFDFVGQDYRKIARNTIIHNPVNNIFFIKKNLNKNKLNFLIIKNFESYKYAGDLTLKFLIKLSKEEYFKHLKFTIIGKGKILMKLKKKLKKFKNIRIIENFIEQKQINEIHKKHKFFIYLTRMDAQSLTLSEALVSNLVCISSNNTAIPEFIKNKKNGFLINNNFYEFEKVIREIYYQKIDLKKFLVENKKFKKDLKPNKIVNDEFNFLKKS